MAGDVGVGNIPGFTWSKPLADLGIKKNWAELERNLSASGIERMWIKDEASRRLMDVIRSSFDVSAGVEAANRDFCVLTFLAVEGNDDLMERLLSLGLNPDVLAGATLNTPSHTCSRNAFVACSELLALCRANATAVNAEGVTPAQRAEIFLSNLNRNPEKSTEDEDKIERFRKIRATWDSIRLFGPPSLAQLAFKRQWWAVKNVCRRKAVDLEEVLSKYCGRDAVEWAVFHGANELADEIKYLFSYPASQQPSRDNQDHTKGMLQEFIVMFGERVSVFEDKFNKLDSRVTAQEGLTRANGPSALHQSQEMGSGWQRSVAQSAAVYKAAGDNPVLQAVDVMWNEIRSKAVNSGQELTILSKLGVLLEELKRA